MTRFHRQLDHVPNAATRYTSLGLVVVVTVVGYYQFFIVSACGAKIIATFHMSSAYFVNISVIGSLAGAAVAYFAGVVDKVGRANVVVTGILTTSLLSLYAFPHTHSKVAFAAALIALSAIEGAVLVATPALVHDFRPQP